MQVMGNEDKDMGRCFQNKALDLKNSFGQKI